MRYYGGPFWSILRLYQIIFMVFIRCTGFGNSLLMFKGMLDFYKKKLYQHHRMRSHLAEDFRLAFEMIGKKLRITIAAGVIAVALYVIVATVSLSGRQQRTLPTTVAPDQEFEDDFDDGSRGLNKHKWDNNCLKTIEQLCNFPVFPKAPDTREESNDFDVTIPRDNGGLRLLGYLRPNSTGKYKLAVASNGVAEVWLSRTKNWRDGQLVAYVSSHNLKQPAQPIKKGNFMASTSQISNYIQLKVRRKYYIEVIVAPGQQWLRENVFVQVAWRRPENTSLEVIDGKFVSPYINDSHKALRKIFDEDLPGALSCAELNRRYVNRYMTAQVVPHLEAKAVENTLPYCEYKPSYLVEPARFKGFSQYSGVYRYARKTFSFPYTNVDGITRNEAAGQAFMAENPLQEQEAKTVVKRYLEALENAYPGKYKLESIAHVEKKEDPEKGSRYLLELNVKDLASGTSYILSEYVYQLRGNNTSLCYPTGMQWNRTADVYLILTSKNLGRWVHHFIKNVEQIVRETNDEHLHVVIFDFDSPDIDLGQVLKNSALSNYRYITQPGSYSRTVSFTEAIKSITDPNAIIVTVDLHLDIGSRFINDIRKHCLKGKTVYAPQIVFLTCGASSARPRGTWYHYSYGTIALYKEDWEKFGGFSPVFAKKVTWGGEDWDIIDGAVKGGLEIERKRGPWVYHYFHDKRGMWQNAPRTASGKS